MGSRERNPIRFSFDPEKAIEVLAYLASKADEVTALDKYKAGKLLFLADKYHLVRYGKPIVGGEYRALEFGPVPQDVLDILHEITSAAWSGPQSDVAVRLLAVVDIDRRFRYPRLQSRGAFSLESLSRSEIMAIDHVISLHGRKTFEELKVLTHMTPAYARAWQSKSQLQSMAVVKYEDFFEEDPDAIEGAFEEMVENDALQSAFPPR